jgi:SPP1 family predicted phage head-tail adaptor
LKPLEAGRLRLRVAIQRNMSKVANAADSFGEQPENWQTIDTVWGALEPLTGRDLLIAQQIQPQVAGQIIIRYRPDTLASDRMMIAGGIYGIAPAIDDEFRHIQMRFPCVRTGGV